MHLWRWRLCWRLEPHVLGCNRVLEVVSPCVRRGAPGPRAYCADAASTSAVYSESASDRAACRSAPCLHGGHFDLAAVRREDDAQPALHDVGLDRRADRRALDRGAAADGEQRVPRRREPRGDEQVGHVEDRVRLDLDGVRLGLRRAPPHVPPQPTRGRLRSTHESRREGSDKRGKLRRRARNASFERGVNMRTGDPRQTDRETHGLSR
eukprot:scaffold29500_cov61-Phaeocystis_antarctica.AAC.4